MSHSRSRLLKPRASSSTADLPSSTLCSGSEEIVDNKLRRTGGGAKLLRIIYKFKKKKMTPFHISKCKMYVMYCVLEFFKIIG